MWIYPHDTVCSAKRVNRTALIRRFHPTQANDLEENKRRLLSKRMMFKYIEATPHDV